MFAVETPHTVNNFLYNKELENSTHAHPPKEQPEAGERVGKTVRVVKAYSTYTRLNGMEPRLTELEEFTNNQMFFMGFMSIFCEENGMDKARLLLHKFNLDRHSMHTVVGNLPEFAAAFHCEPDMPLNPNERCSIW
ncbi:peptidase family M13 [Necator americanus]|uniref:Peptidase family M13 n=1 Tax=Necator americanus TaxID=51031 RepID=W2SW91_NECAM|nr:peptidase family M13 [Necator americanus]ETN72972.1 peptidase family M13 [Necator americanus]